MAEQDIADIAATVDGDTSWGDDMRGAIATLSETRLPQIARSAIASTRLNSTGHYWLTCGPWYVPGNTSAQPPGWYYLGLNYVRGGTPDTVSVRVATGTATSTVYYVLYNLDANGHPDTLANSWGPFTVTSSNATVELTGQTQTIVAGMYWVGTLAASGNGGNPVLYGARPAYYGMGRTTTPTDNILVASLADATPRATMTGTMRTSDAYDTQNGNVAYLFGKDT